MGMSRRSLADGLKFQRKLLTPFQVTPVSLVKNHTGSVVTVDDSPDGTDDGKQCVVMKQSKSISVSVGIEVSCFNDVYQTVS